MSERRKITVSRLTSNTDIFAKELSESLNYSYPTSNTETIDIIAYAGKLGVVVDIHLDRQGPPFICNIRDTSPLKNQIKLGDRIIAVDDKDVHKWSANRSCWHKRLIIPRGR